MTLLAASGFASAQIEDAIAGRSKISAETPGWPNCCIVLRPRAHRSVATTPSIRQHRVPGGAF